MSQSSASLTTVTKSKIFVNENLSRVENRINVMLFGAQAIPAFWQEFCSYLKLPDDAWLDRVVIDQTSLRPDFRVMQDDKPTGWIEVELGDRDEQQIVAYKAKFARLPVHSLVGPATNKHGDASLEKVSEIAKRVADDMAKSNRPAKAVLRSLAHLIDTATLAGSSKAAKAEIPSSIMERFQTVLEPLLDLRQKGLLENKPINPSSLSLRLKKGPSIKCTDSFALLTMTDGVNFLVPSPGFMADILRGPLDEVVTGWKALLDRVHPAWASHINGNGRIKIQADIVEQNSACFAHVYTLLRDLLIGPSALSA